MKHLFPLFLLACMLLVCFELAAQSHPTMPKRTPFRLAPDAQYLPGRIIFRIKPGFRDACSASAIDLPAIQATLDGLGVQSLEKIFPHIEAPVKETDPFGQPLVDLSLIYVAVFDSSLPVEQAINLLLFQPEIEYCEPWYLADVFLQPNDPFADTTGGASGQWHLRQIWARQAWDIQTGDSSNVVVGVTDTGISFQHPDLQSNIAFNTDDPIDGVDNDQDGYVDNYRGWDFGGVSLGSVGDNDPTFAGDHGVGVTGAFGATTNNGIGVAGVCHNCKYLPIKSGPDPGGISHGYTSIVYAVEQGAQIVNCSWGGTDNSRFGADVIDYATINRGAAIVVACGNSQVEQVYFPAGYDRVLSVANSKGGDTLHHTSTYHATVDVAAPGVSIQTTNGHGGYGSGVGTSYASPVAAGVVALTLAHFPGMNGFQAAQRVRITSDDHYGPNFDKIGKAGKGRINAYRALTDPLRPAIRRQVFSAQSSRGHTDLQAGDTIEIRATFINYLDAANNLIVTLSTTDSLQNALITVLDAPQAIGPLATNQGFSIQQQPLRIYLHPGAPVDFKVALRLNYSDAATGYEDFEYIEFWANRSFIDITENDLHTTITSKGNFGFNDFGPNEQGLGVAYGGMQNALFEGGFLIGKSLFEVSDNIRGPAVPPNDAVQDDDFAVVERVRRLNPTLSAFESEGIFDDSQADSPIGITVRQKAYAFDSPGDEDFVILTYSVKNNQAIPLNNVYAGLFADWDIAVLSERSIRDACSYDLNEKMGFAYGLAGANGNYYGISLLSDEAFKSYAMTGTSGFGFDSPSKYIALANTPSSGSASAGASVGGADIRQFVSGGPVSIPAQSEHVFAFSVMAGGIYQQLVQSRAAAQEKYRCVILGEGPVAGFSVSDSLAAPGAPIQFSDNNVSATSWSWDFGDGQTASTATPMHSYSQPGTYTVILTVSNGDCEVQSRRTIGIDASTALSGTLTLESMTLFPNPGKGAFHLCWQAPQQGSFKVSLMDLRGREIWHQVVYKTGAGLEQDFDPGALPPGTYLLTLAGQGIRITRKLSIVP